MASLCHQPKSVSANAEETSARKQLTNLYGCYDLMIIADAYTGQIVAPMITTKSLKGIGNRHEHHWRTMVP